MIAHHRLIVGAYLHGPCKVDQLALSVSNDDAVVMLFNRFLAEKILAGEKTQTRRSTERKRGVRVYEVGDRVRIQIGYRRPVAYFIVKNRRKQAIGDITEEDPKKEGFANVDEFKQFWLDFYGRWDPAEEVWVYDFVLDKKDLPSKDNNAGQEEHQSGSH